MKKLLPPQLAMFCVIAMVSVKFLLGHPPMTGLWVTQAAGVVLAVLGLAIASKAKKRFIEAGTNVDTFEKPGMLITDGWFSRSRNPMYLGMLLLLVGAALALDSVEAFVGPVVFYLAATYWYIPYEENAAKAEFGTSYTEYCGRVRRWI